MPCMSCLDRRVIVREGRTNAVAESCPDCSPVCPRCGGRGYIYGPLGPDRYVYASPCECRERLSRIQRFNAAQIPARFHNSKLETFEERVNQHHEIVDYLDGWRRDFRSGAEGILFVGATGTGKTHLLCSLLRYLALEEGVDSRFVDFFHLLGLIREAYSARRSEMSVLGPLMEVTLLAIDELGKGKAGDWERGVLDQLISYRYNQELTTLFTTNHGLSQEAPDRKLPERLVFGSAEDLEKIMGTTPLEERIGVRVYSRIREMCQPVLLSGAEDIRSGERAFSPIGG